MRKFIQICVLYVLPILAFANQAEDIEGVWLNAKGDGFIEFKISDGVLSGTIIGSPLPEDQLRKDENNPDPALRERLLQGITILNDFSYDGGKRWQGGTIYDPNNGKTYNCKITLIDIDTIEVRGYVGIALFGRTEVWQRQ